VVKNSLRMIENLAFKIGFWRYLTTDSTTSTDKRETWDLGFVSEDRGLSVAVRVIGG
jgi:hypothetical protein